MMKTRDSRGYMLLEAILATAMIAVALFALINSLGRCLAAARSVQNYAIAETLLANKSYEFRVEKAADYDNQEGVFDDYPGYTWRREFEMTETEGLWKQTVTVFWTERGRSSSDTLTEFRYLPDKPR
jgi:Tfp pilus assembly protein PilV